MSKHTPTPWRYEVFKSEYGISQPKIMVGTDFVAEVSHSNLCIGNAQFIVTACNYHERLKESLREALQCIKEIADTGDDVSFQLCIYKERILKELDNPELMKGSYK